MGFQMSRAGRLLDAFEQRFTNDSAALFSIIQAIRPNVEPDSWHCPGAAPGEAVIHLSTTGYNSLVGTVFLQFWQQPIQTGLFTEEIPDISTLVLLEVFPVPGSYPAFSFDSKFISDGSLRVTYVTDAADAFVAPVLATLVPGDVVIATTTKIRNPSPFLGL